MKKGLPKRTHLKSDPPPGMNTQLFYCYNYKHDSKKTQSPTPPPLPPTPSL
jgi:hypothetical protein